jgi:hypothetical protein
MAIARATAVLSAPTRVAGPLPIGLERLRTVVMSLLRENERLLARLGELYKQVADAKSKERGRRVAASGDRRARARPRLRIQREMF